MEDFVRVQPSFAGREGWLYAGVFDGHNGDEVSRRASEELHGILAEELEQERPVDAAIRSTFLTFDERVAEEEAGATAAVLVLQGDSLTVGNAGDSHVALISKAGVGLLTTDHRLTNEGEYRRVVGAGGRVVGQYAVLPWGKGLVCTRSLGDRPFRRIGIIPEPDVSERILGPEDEWLILGSDGVWDGLTPEAVADLARGEASAQSAADRIRASALEKNDDNVSVIAIRLVRGDL